MPVPEDAGAEIRTVSSMGEELKVSFGTYEGSKNGWNAYLSLYSDGVLLYSDSFIVGYEALSGKKAPNMETELDDKVIEEYTNNVDMYNSLLVRGDPIIYFEIDYSVKAESDEKPSEYLFNFNKIRMINTVSEKVMQTSVLNKTQPRSMSPIHDLREITGIVANEKEHQRHLSQFMKFGTINLLKAEEIDKKYPLLYKVIDDLVKESDNSNALISKKYIEEDVFKSVLNNKITSYYYVQNGRIKDEGTCVEYIDFCNKLNEIFGLSPTYDSYKHPSCDSACTAYVRFKENTTKGFYLAEIYDRKVIKYPHKKATDEFDLRIYERFDINPFKIRYE